MGGAEMHPLESFLCDEGSQNHFPVAARPYGSYLAIHLTLLFQPCLSFSAGTVVPS